MSNAANTILSRLSDDEFVDRESELARVCDLAQPGPGTPETRARSASITLLLGGARVGKSEILRRSFDRLFKERAEIIPIFYDVGRTCLDLEKFARDYFSHVLAQFVAFRRNDSRLLSARDEPLAVISRAALPEDYLFVRSFVDSFTRASQSEDRSLMVRFALASPAAAAANVNLKPLVMIDNTHLIANGEIHSEFMRGLGGNGVPETSYVLSGLERLMSELIPPKGELFDKLALIRVERLSYEHVERFVRRRAELLGIEISDATIELMMLQLDHDVFYIHAILDAAASRGSSLKTFIEFEKLYTSEVRSGLIGHYLSALLRDVAPDSRVQRAAVEALMLLIEAGLPVPVDDVAERMSVNTSGAEALLARMHARELIDVSYGFVKASADQVLADYVRATYRSQISGARGPVAGEELLNEKLKQSHRLMMARYNRAVESQLVEVLSRFDFQSVPASLFDDVSYQKRYRGMSRVQVRRALDDEPERVRLPQIVLVHDLGAGDQAGLSWRLFAATGFEGGIYTESNEVLWLIALINSKEPLDVEMLGQIDQRLESAVRSHKGAAGMISHAIRWYTSKEGFSAIAYERLASLHAYCSTYVHLDLIQDYLTRLALGGEPRPASVFEIVIPAEGEAELIAARTAEQIARAADFDAEAINQIKTALIEACINAAEHSDSPDRKIYQRFAIDEDKLIITVSNKGKTFGRANEQSTPSIAARPAKGARGRGLQIIRALMDEVKFEPTDDGSRLVMTKYLKRSDNQ
jgi:serine/threonine-protein kinase RsbW